MNLQRPNANEATRTTNRSKSVVPMSGLCTRCLDGCTGNCEVFKASFRGRELIYPGPFGEIIAGGDKPIFTGALGSTEIARKNWDHVAIGAAISGITLVCGENVCGIDPLLKLDLNYKNTNRIYYPDLPTVLPHRY